MPLCLPFGSPFAPLHAMLCPFAYALHACYVKPLLEGLCGTAALHAALHGAKPLCPFAPERAEAVNNFGDGLLRNLIEANRRVLLTEIDKPIKY